MIKANVDLDDGLVRSAWEFRDVETLSKVFAGLGRGGDDADSVGFRRLLATVTAMGGSGGCIPPELGMEIHETAAQVAAIRSDARLLGGALNALIGEWYTASPHGSDSLRRQEFCAMFLLYWGCISTTAWEFTSALWKMENQVPGISLRDAPYLAQALRVVAAIHSGNYISYFRMLATSPSDRLRRVARLAFDRVRARATACVHRAYRPVPDNFIDILASKAEPSNLKKDSNLDNGFEGPHPN